MSRAPEDPLRRLARERGVAMGELGVRTEDESWARSEAGAIASLVTPSLALRLPAALVRLCRRIARAAR